MIRTTRSVVPVAAALTLLAGVSGCGGGAPPAIPAPEPFARAVEVVEVEEPRWAEREPDLPARERWASPFAVSALGRIEPLEPRRVEVVDADPRIREGIAGQRAVAARVAGGSVDAAREVTANRPAPDATERTSSTPVVAPRPAEPPRPAARPARRTHLVQRGDTWYGIARQYGIPARALADANPDVNPDRILIGQTLVIPAAVD
jgi:LysM repeat protein